MTASTLDPLTWDSVVAAGLFGLAATASLVLYFYRRMEPGRTFVISFQEHPWTVPLGELENSRPENEVQVKTGPDNLAVLYVHLTVRRPVSIAALSFLLVERQFRPHWVGLWRWTRAATNVASVTNVWDAGHEVASKRETWGTGEPSPTARLNDDGGYTVRYSQPKHLLVGDSLWYRVIVQVGSDWQGLLEFQGPSSAGYPVYKRRKVMIEK